MASCSQKSKVIIEPAAAVAAPSSDVLPVVPSSSSALNQLRGYRIHNVESCIICTEPYDGLADVVCLPNCSHVFHETCAAQWITKSATCPICSTPLLPSNQDIRIVEEDGKNDVDDGDTKANNTITLEEAESMVQLALKQQMQDISFNAHNFTAGVIEQHSSFNHANLVDYDTNDGDGAALVAMVTLEEAQLMIQDALNKQMEFSTSSSTVRRKHYLPSSRRVYKCPDHIADRRVERMGARKGRRKSNERTRRRRS